MKSTPMIVHNENSLLTTILKSIHHRMTPYAKKIIKANFILVGMKELDFRETSIDSFCKTQWDSSSQFFAQNLQFENSQKQMLSVDYIVIKNGILYLCDLQFSARVEKKQVRKGLSNAFIIKEWLKNSNAPFKEIHIGSYYWGRQRKVEPIEHMYLSRDFCSLFSLPFESIEQEIKKSAKELFQSSLDSIDNNQIGFETLLKAQEEGLKKYNPLSDEVQTVLF